MKLTLDQIRSVTTGAVSVTQESDGIHFYRFTSEQMTLCQPHIGLYAEKLTSCAGIRLSFRTNSTGLYLRAGLSLGSSRTFFSFDLTVNGVYTDALDNFSGLELPDEYGTMAYPLPATCEKHFDLGEGEKDVCLFLPWSMTVALQELSLDDGSSVIPLIPSKKLLAFGDSITQGYDILRPSNHFVARLARALDAEEYNKAIGGAIAFPEMSQMKEPFTPDYILVAYGTNDWALSEESFFIQQYRALHQVIQENYPTAQVFALTPLWRPSANELGKMGAFSNAEKNILSICKDFPNVTTISCFDFLPKEPTIFADLIVHPTDIGFDHYFNHLWPEIRAALKG